MTSTDTLDQTTGTNPLFQNYGCKVNRMNDRVLIGAATVNDANYPSTMKDWLEQLVPATTSIAQLASISTFGGIGVLGGARASDSGASGPANSFGIAGIVQHDDAANSKVTWGVYGEARRIANANGIAQATEFDIINLAGGSAGYIDPYDMFANLTSINLWASCGRPDVASSDATIALGIINNAGEARTSSGRYTCGICFDAHAILGTDGVSGLANAIMLAKGHQMNWYYGAGRQAGGIYSNVTAAANAQWLAFSDMGLCLTQGNAGPVLFNIPPVANAANYLRMLANAAGGAVSIDADGADADIDITIRPKGAGSIDISGSTADAATAGAVSVLPDTPAGYLKIKVNGADYRVAIYNP